MVFQVKTQAKKIPLNCVPVHREPVFKEPVHVALPPVHGPKATNGPVGPESFLHHSTTLPPKVCGCELQNNDIQGFGLKDSMLEHHFLFLSCLTSHLALNADSSKSSGIGTASVTHAIKPSSLQNRKHKNLIKAGVPLAAPRLGPHHKGPTGPHPRDHGAPRSRLHPRPQGHPIWRQVYQLTHLVVEEPMLYLV